MTDTGGVTLSDWLLARIAEDEALIAEADPDVYSVAPPWAVFQWGYEIDINLRRLRAECEAKRRIVEMHWPAHRLPDDPDREPDEPTYMCGGHEWVAYPCDTLRLLALPYSGHPEYRQEWAP